MILACFDSRREDGYTARPNPEHIFFAVADLEAALERGKVLGCRGIDPAVRSQPWGERSFYFVDPIGDKIRFVDETTVFTGK